MRFIVTSDLHIHPFKECSRDGGMDRLADGLSALQQTLDWARKHKCPWLFLGDMKMPRTFWPQGALTGILRILADYEDVEKIMIAGNHDGIDSVGMTGLSPFYPFATVIEAPEVVSAGDLLRWGGTGLRFPFPVAFWPWQPTLDQLPAFLGTARKAEARVLFAHAFLSGAVVGPTDMRVPGIGIPLDQFGLAGSEKVFDAAFVGDIHKQQKLGGREDQATVWYSGSPYGQSWGELEKNKGCLLAEINDRGSQVVVTSLPISAPRFLVEEWTGTESHFIGAKERWEGNFVRLLVPPKEDFHKLEQLREESGVRALQVIVQQTEEIVTRVLVHAGLPLEEILQKYVEARPCPDVAAEWTLQAGVRLMRGQA